MSREAVAEILVRSVLDEDFRARVLSDPADALAEFDLTELEREILIARDERMFGLLGEAVPGPSAPQSAATAHAADGDAPSPAAVASMPVVPDVRLTLSLTPHATQLPDGSTERIAFEASLRAWSASDGALDPQSGTVAWRIDIRPSLVSSPDGQVRIAYDAAITPAAAPQSAASSAPATIAARSARAAIVAGAPWDHHLGSSAVREAAAAVRSAKAGERLAPLLELARVMQSTGACDD